MNDVQALRQQVKRLKARLDQIEGASAAQTVSEIVGTNADEPKGFHAACERCGAIAHSEQRSKLVARLNSSGYTTEADLDQLRWEFRSVHDVEALIANKAAGNVVR